jgi:hypothetical protein
MHGRGAHLKGFVHAVVSSGQVREVEVHSCRAHGSSLAVARPYSPVPYHRPNPPAGQEGRWPRMPGITPAPARQCAAGTLREGVASAPLWGINRAIQGGSVSGDSMHRGEALAATRRGSAVRAHQAAGAARKHRQGRLVEGGGETGHSLVHRWAPSLS